MPEFYTIRARKGTYKMRSAKVRKRTTYKMRTKMRSRLEVAPPLPPLYAHYTLATFHH